jgi:DNA-binding NtrC family response regulator
MAKLPNCWQADSMLRGRKILIVDDEEDLRDVLSARFEMEGCEVSTAENGRIALELLTTTRFDAVVSDVRMPDMSGLELLRRIRSLQPTPTAVMISGFADVDRAQVIALGASSLLIKPFDLEEVVVAVSQSFSMASSTFRN